MQIRASNRPDITWPVTPCHVYLGLWLIFNLLAGYAQAVELPHSDKVGVFRQGTWYLDLNGNGVMDGAPTDGILTFGQPDDLPLAGTWSDQGTDAVGIFRQGLWLFDLNANGAWDGAPIDRTFNKFGQSADLPVVGDWNGGGKKLAGIYRQGYCIWI